MERSEADLAATLKAIVERVEALKKAEGEKETLRIKADKLRNEGKVTEVKLKGANQENSQSKKKIEELRTGLAA